jgi:pyruvate/2-oxoacid:ferredoxin oxidoreductase beta subunit
LPAFLAALVIPKLQLLSSKTLDTACATTPATALIPHPQVTPEGRGPAWASSLLEDNAQFGFGIYHGLKQRRAAYMDSVRQLLQDEGGPGSEELRSALQGWLQVGAENI